VKQIGINYDALWPEGQRKGWLVFGPDHGAADESEKERLGGLLRVIPGDLGERSLG
jgi:hypothetical protein